MTRLPSAKRSMLERMTPEDVVTFLNGGSLKRMESTVIGDTVNLTSRIEGLTKQYKKRVLVSAATRDLVTEGFSFEEPAATEGRGRKQLVQIYAVTGASPR